MSRSSSRSTRTSAAKRARVSPESTIRLINIFTSPRVPVRVLGYLNDRDVLTNLAITTRLIRPFLMGYPVKRSVDTVLAALLTNQYRYIWLAITRSHDVPMSVDMRRATSLTELKFDHVSNLPIVPSSMPPYLTHLTLGRSFNQYIKPGDIGHSVTHLTIGDSFNLILAPGAIPASVTHLKFGHCFNQLLTNGMLPEDLESLEFGACHNQPILIRLPVRLKRLKFGYMFNSVISSSSIPASLTHIWFGEGFKYAFNIPRAIPNIKFESVFSHYCMIGSIPMCVTRLQLGRMYDDESNHTIGKHVVPQYVTHLEVSQDIEMGTIPPSVKHLTLGARFSTHLVAGMIPDSVTHLKLDHLFDYPLTRNIIPSSVTHLSLRGPLNYRTAASALPSSITHLQLGFHIQGKQLILPAVAIPTSVTHLMLHQPIKGPLPQSVKHLVIGMYFNQDITNRLIPSSVTSLVLDCELSKRMEPGSLPYGITHLTFGDEWWPFIAKGVIPDSVTHLRFGRRYALSSRAVDSQPGDPILLAADALPASVTHIDISSLGTAHELWCDRDPFWHEQCEHQEIKSLSN